MLLRLQNWIQVTQSHFGRPEGSISTSIPSAAIDHDRINMAAIGRLQLGSVFLFTVASCY